MSDIMQAVPVEFEDDHKPTGTDYVNEVDRSVRQPIREAIQTLCDYEGTRGERASKLRRRAIDAIITSLERWEQIDNWLSDAHCKKRPEIPVSITGLALREDQGRKTEFINQKLSTIDHLLGAFDPDKDSSEGTSHADLIWSFTETVNETADRINELLYERKKPPIDGPHTINWTPYQKVSNFMR